MKKNRFFIRYHRLESGLNASRAGSAMLLLLLAVATAGLVVARLLPASEVASQRRTENSLRHALAEIRQAFDLKEMVDSTFNPDLSTPQKVAQSLAQLQSENLLRNSYLSDPSILPGHWNTSTFTYWIGTSNVSFNTSFESEMPPNFAMAEVVASWYLGTFNTLAATDSKFFPSQYSGQADDYDGQNKLGRKLGLTGQSLMILK